MKFFRIENIRIKEGHDIYINPDKIAAIEQDATKKDSCGVLLEGVTKPIFIPISATDLVRLLKEY